MGLIMKSKEFLNQLSYLREVYIYAKNEYEKAIRYDLVEESEKAAPHMISAAKIISEALDRLAEDKNFDEGLYEYINDVENNYPEVRMLLEDWDEFLEIEYKILIQEKYTPKEAIELIQSLTIPRRFINNLRNRPLRYLKRLLNREEIANLRRELQKSSLAMFKVQNDLEKEKKKFYVFVKIFD